MLKTWLLMQLQLDPIGVMNMSIMRDGVSWSTKDQRQASGSTQPAHESRKLGHSHFLCFAGATATDRRKPPNFFINPVVMFWFASMATVTCYALNHRCVGDTLTKFTTAFFPPLLNRYFPQFDRYFRPLRLDINGPIRFQLRFNLTGILTFDWPANRFQCLKKYSNFNSVLESTG